MLFLIKTYIDLFFLFCEEYNYSNELEIEFVIYQLWSYGYLKSTNRNFLFQLHGIFWNISSTICQSLFEFFLQCIGILKYLKGEFPVIQPNNMTYSLSISFALVITKQFTFYEHLFSGQAISQIYIARAMILIL